MPPTLDPGAKPPAVATKPIPSSKQPPSKPTSSKAPAIQTAPPPPVTTTPSNASSSKQSSSTMKAVNAPEKPATVTPKPPLLNTQLTLAGVALQEPPVTFPKWLVIKIDEWRDSMGSLGPLDGVYLGRSRLSTTISWHPHATGHALITNEALTAYNDAHTRYLQLSNGGDDDGNHNDDGEETPSPPEPATLCILARISRDGTFVAPDGRYGQGFQRKFEKPFEKTQLNFTLECLSEYPKLAAEFDKAVDRLKSLFADADPTKTRPRAGVIADSNAATAQESQSVPVRIKLRHVVFAPRTEENETIAEGLPAECSIEHWPVDEPAKAALKQLQSTHVAQPLNAYDTDGNLILPSRYDRLRGAICAVRFNVLHYTMADGDKSQNKMADGGKRQNKLKDVFVADVVGISVIHSAPLPSTPKKRVSISDPYSPSKKKKNT